MRPKRTFQEQMKKGLGLLEKEAPSVNIRAVELFKKGEEKTLLGAIKRARKELGWE